MRHLSRLRPSPAMVVAGIALVVAMAGTGYAAVGLPKNSVGSTQIKPGAVGTTDLANNAVTSTKVKNGSLLKADFKVGQIPAGPPGPQGLQGPQGTAGAAGAQGPPGPGARWVFVNYDGNIVAQSSGLNAGVIHPSTGLYYVNFGSSVSGHNVQVTEVYRDSDDLLRGAPLTAICGGGTDGATCSYSNNSSTVYVGQFGPGNASFQNHSFYVAVF